ncbi:hypothetical protein ACQ4M3_18975 [Leptolyngbya sp. AN03gr2]|uniref:hypothetical protein n=1 Tax=Leptolyngbya sp. AN03gr2 TaxID=3423364 RepID=UPI003D3152CA
MVLLEESEALNFVARYYSDKPISTPPSLRIKEWWAVKQFDPVLYTTPTFFGSQKTPAILEQPYKTIHNDVYVGWKLEYRADLESEFVRIVSGNSQNQICHYQTTGTWPAGIYLFSAALFTFDLLRQSEAFATWTLIQPSDRLGSNQPLSLL